MDIYRNRVRAWIYPCRADLGSLDLDAYRRGYRVWHRGTDYDRASQLSPCITPLRVPLNK